MSKPKLPCKVFLYSDFDNFFRVQHNKLAFAASLPRKGRRGPNYYDNASGVIRSLLEKLLTAVNTPNEQCHTLLIEVINGIPDDEPNLAPMPEIDWDDFTEIRYKLTSFFDEVSHK